MSMKQQAVHDALYRATLSMNELWTERYHNFDTLGVSKAVFSEYLEFLGGVRNNLHNFTRGAFLPPGEKHRLPSDRLEQLNEAAWQRDQADPKFHQTFRIFFPNGRIPTSMDMTRLGVALLAETNLLRLTDVPLEPGRALQPGEDAVSLAEAIVRGPPPSGHSKEWAKRVKNLLDYRPESDLRADPNFATFVLAVREFQDH